MLSIGYQQIGEATGLTVRRFSQWGRVLTQPEGSSTIYYWLLLSLYLGSSDRLFSPLCDKSWGSQSRVFLHRCCHYAYFGPWLGWANTGPLWPRKGDPTLPYSLRDFDGHPLFFQVFGNVYSCCGNLGDRACFSLPFIVGPCGRQDGIFSGTSHGNVHRIFRLGNEPGASDHGHHYPFYELPDDVPLFSSRWHYQFKLFLFFREKKGVTFVLPILTSILIDTQSVI